MSRTRSFAFLVAAAMLAATAIVRAGGVGISTPPEEENGGSSPQVLTDRFYALRPGPPNSFARRDLEFHWDSLYTLVGAGHVGLTGTEVTTLMRLGTTLADSVEGKRNLFGANLTDVRLVYEYFRSAARPEYDVIDFLNPIPFTVGSPFEVARHWDGTTWTATPPLPIDYGHSDVYLYLSGHAGNDGGRFDSYFQDFKEDSSSGRWFSPSNLDVFHSNSIMFPGPDSGAVQVDTSGTGWTRYDREANVGIMHEFQHSLADEFNAVYVDEILSSGAELLSGIADTTSLYEVPYTWDLVSAVNYQNWQMFAAYLLLNFRGVDTTATLVGFADDLTYRWAKGGKHMFELGDQLTDANCAECASKPYFFRNGQPLDAQSRLALLMHNWRVANYINHPSLADGQYGYPPQFEYSPKRYLRPWQSVYHDSSTLQVAIPPELVSDPGWKSREVAFAGKRYLGTHSYSMKFAPAGSEYWVIRSGPAMTSQSYDLVVRVAADSLFREIRSLPGVEDCTQVDGRLMASIVGYQVPNSDSLATGQLWAHPEWVSAISEPQWVDVDSLAGEIELTLGGFGQTNNAAVVVLSLADGPGRGWAALTAGALGDNYSGNGHATILPYRISAGLRAAPNPSVSSSAVVATAGQPDEHPAWSPSGNDLVFESVQPEQPSYRQIYRSSTSGGSVTRLLAQDKNQGQPDWSPRGDWVAFVRDSTEGLSDVWLFNTQTSQSGWLTNQPGMVRSPVFEPNGQRIAYAHFPHVVGNNVYDMWELRTAQVDGSGDGIVSVLGTAVEITSVRWAPDGNTIFFTRNDSLYSVEPTTGAVAPQTRLAPSAASVDFRAGSRQTLFEQNRTFRWRATCNPTTYQHMPVRRVALRDTLNGDTQARLYVTGAEFFQPRWSPDGTRIAYASTQNAPGDRDLFIGQVSWNHAPKFNDAPRDTVIPSTCASQPFVQDFTALDPDGEAMTYEAVCLPNSASFTAQGEFTWPKPIDTPGDHYVVFRVLDGSGGLDQRVVKYTVATDPTVPGTVADLTVTMGKNSVTANWTDTGEDGWTGTSCLARVRYGTSPITEANFFSSDDTLAAGMPGPPGNINCAEKAGLTPCTWYYFGMKTRDDAGNWSALSNGTLGRTRCSGTLQQACTWESGGMLMAQGGDGSGWSLDNGVLWNAVADEMRSDRHHLKRNSNANGAARVRLSRRGSASVSLDAVDLSYVDHEPAVSLFLAGDQVLAGTLADALEVRDETGHDVTNNLSHGNDVVTAPAGGAWIVDLGSGTGDRAFYLDAAGGSTIGDITVEIETSPGSWQTAATLKPRWTFAPLVIPTEGTRKARLTFANETSIRRIAVLAVSGTPPRQSLTLSTAQHSKLGSVAAALAEEGGSEALVRPHEYVEVEFDQPALAEGQVRDYFLGVRGRRVNPGSTAMRGGRSEGDTESPLAPIAPLSFALHQAEPTPFSHATRIRFDLPRPAWVHLDVFDLQGRRIASLADEFLPAGQHARQWNGTVASGGRAPHGIYLYRIRAGENEDQKKLVLMP